MTLTEIKFIRLGEKFSNNFLPYLNNNFNLLYTSLIFHVFRIFINLTGYELG